MDLVAWLLTLACLMVRSGTAAAAADSAPTVLSTPVPADNLHTTK